MFSRQTDAHNSFEILGAVKRVTCVSTQLACVCAGHYGGVGEKVGIVLPNVRRMDDLSTQLALPRTDLQHTRHSEVKLTWLLTYI